MNATCEELVARILSEQPIPLSAAAARLGHLEGRGPVHPSTLARWANKGVARPDGSRVRLEVVRVGSRSVTSWAAVVRFLAAQQPGDAAPAPRSPALRRKASERAVAELGRLGI